MVASEASEPELPRRVDVCVFAVVNEAADTSVVLVEGRVGSAGRRGSSGVLDEGRGGDDMLVVRLWDL